METADRKESQDERNRLAALRAEAILDTEPESSFDDLTGLASYIGGMPKRIALAVDVQSVEANVDRHRIVRLIDNLASNALKFTADKGTVTLRAAPDGDFAHLFTRFSRASNAGGFAGTGLGLSIAKAIVDAHDGTLDVATREGSGTTFTVRLPR